MPPPPNKKIHVTLLWADRAAVDQDFAARYSQTLVTWAKAFFGKYGFELDVVPAPGSTAQEAYRYTLADSNGYEPDVTSFEDFWDRWRSAIVPPSALAIQADHDRQAAASRKAANGREIDASLQRLRNATLGEIQPELAKLLFLWDEWKRVTLDFLEKDRAYNDLQAKIAGLMKGLEKEKEERDIDTPARRAIGQKISGKQNAAIADDDRLKVLFARFKLSPTATVKTKDPEPHGVTRDPLTSNSVNGEVLWNKTFCMINVDRPDEPITLAHEIVHAAGRRHKPDFKRMKKLFAWVQSIETDPKTGRQTMPELMERVKGGYNEDPPLNDIINYNSMGKKPEEVVLIDPDRVNLEQKALFVGR